MSKNDCFAYGGNHYCTALTIMNCRRCKFYKSKEKHDQQIEELERMRYTKEYRDMVKRIKENCEQWTNFKMEESKPRASKTVSKSGKMLYNLRLEKQMSQREMGNLIGCSQGKVCNMENRGLSAEDQEMVCRALLLPDDYFKGEE